MTASYTEGSDIPTKLEGMLQKVGGFAKWKTGNVYWQFRGGTQPLSVENTTATFGATAEEGGAVNRRRFAIENEIIADLLRNLTPTDVFYDVGANTGLYTCFVAQKATEGEVIAFEPYPPNVKQLEKNLAYNRLENVEIFDLALSNSTGQIGFEQPQTDHIGYGKGAISSQGKDLTTVATVEGDTLIDDGTCPPPDVIKIDVEGAEHLVLDGLGSAIERGPCRLLYCEVHTDEKPRKFSQSTEEDVRSVESKLEELGFRTTRLNSNGKVQVKAYDLSSSNTRP